MDRYKRFKNKLNNLLRIAKHHYYEDLIEHNKSNCKKTWSILNEVIINKNEQRNSSLPSTFVINDYDCSDSRTIADHFCDYSSNIGPKLSKKLLTAPVSHTSFFTGNFTNTMFFKPTTEQEIIAVSNLSQMVLPLDTIIYLLTLLKTTSTKFPFL
jgi:hypothetical protein